MWQRSILVPLTGCALACSGSAASDETADARHRSEVVAGMRSAVIEQLSDLVTAAQSIQSAAPTDPNRGWSSTEDAQAIAAMKQAWERARSAYEHVEGAVAPLFPDLDAAIDARYDDFLARLSPHGDDNLFDGQGVTGMHAVERILYSDVSPARVVQFESVLPGSRPAGFPTTAAEASDFKGQLCEQLVSDVRDLRAAWKDAVNYDLDAAFRGLIALVNEQREKVDKASTNEEESRYAQRTMQDIRDNLAGTRAIYGLFKPWLRSKAADGVSIDSNIEHGFSALEVLYQAVPGNAVPETPVSWSSANPSAADAGTPFGSLYLGVRDAVDPNRPGSLVHEMNRAAALLGFPGFAEEP